MSEKFIHYRDLYSNIDHTNFQISTKVDFKRVFKKNKGVLKLWEQIKNESNIKGFYNSRSGSQYIITQEGDLYRLSDHWGAVASCEWTLEGEGNLNPMIFLTGPLEIGKASLKDFKLSDRRYNKDRVVNPEWREKIEPVKAVVQKLALLKAQESFQNYKVKDKILIGTSFSQFRKEIRLLNT